MKQIILRSIIAISTFALGALVFYCVFVYFDFTSEKIMLPTSDKQSIQSERPIYAFCELANNPQIYDDKIVRVSAKLRQYDDGYKFKDLNCYGEKKEAAVIFNDNFQQIMKKIGQELSNTRFDYTEKYDLIAVGKFKSVVPTNQSNNFADKAYLQFEIIDVEKASPLP